MPSGAQGVGGWPRKARDAWDFDRRAADDAWVTRMERGGGARRGAVRGATAGAMS